MGPRELLKSSSSSFGRAGYRVMNWDPSLPRASPSALGLGQTPDGGMVPAKALRRSSQ